MVLEPARVGQHGQRVQHGIDGQYGQQASRAQHVKTTTQPAIDRTGRLSQRHRHVASIRLALACMCTSPLQLLTRDAWLRAIAISACTRASHGPFE